ncbi:MAG: hypothetical protein CM15mP62_34600 [Rhodospirillaceae bacterium]|nr:MAG: hypothetical protein CM15mP62_34600 [Rhodospirillaceae bacterium]
MEKHGGDTLNRAELTERVFMKRLAFAKRISELVEAVLGEMSNALIRGESLKFHHWQFYHWNKSERIGRNPKTGERCQLLPVG